MHNLRNSGQRRKWRVRRQQDIGCQTNRQEAPWTLYSFCECLLNFKDMLCNFPALTFKQWFWHRDFHFLWIQGCCLDASLEVDRLGSSWHRLIHYLSRSLQQFLMNGLFNCFSLEMILPKPFSFPFPACPPVLAARSSNPRGGTGNFLHVSPQLRKQRSGR